MSGNVNPNDKPKNMIYGYELRKVPGFERLCWVKGDNVTKALTGNHTYLGRYVDEIWLFTKRWYTV